MYKMSMDSPILKINQLTMKLVFLTALLITFLIGFGAAYSVPTGDGVSLAERANPALKYLKVKAPSDDMGPAANAIAAAVDGLVFPLKLFTYVTSTSTTRVHTDTSTATFSSEKRKVITVAKSPLNFPTIQH
jgi:hypothetical protein